MTMGSDDATDLAERAVAHGALQKVTELAWLIDVIRERPRPKRILEIGSWEGGMLWLWQQLADEVWSIDVRIVPTKDWMDRHRLHFIRAPSIDAVRFIPPQTVFDLVFIDGDHSTPGVNADWGLYSPLARVVVLHDIVPWSPTAEEAAQGFLERGVEALWHRIKSEHTTLEFNDPATQLLADGRSLDHRDGGIGVVLMEEDHA